MDDGETEASEIGGAGQSTSNNRQRIGAEAPSDRRETKSKDSPLLFAACKPRRLYHSCSRCRKPSADRYVVQLKVIKIMVLGRGPFAGPSETAVRLKGNSDAAGRA